MIAFDLVDNPGPAQQLTQCSLRFHLSGDVVATNAGDRVLAVDDLQIGLSCEIGKRRRQRLRRDVDLDRLGHCRHGSHQCEAQDGGGDAAAQTQGGSIQWIGAHKTSGSLIVRACRIDE
ncbi:hypothetical protein D3C72_2030310 [compost metagenome]